MYDPYSWYLMTTYSNVNAGRATGSADLHFVVMLPVVSVLVCIALAACVHRCLREPGPRLHPSKLTRPERRTLAQMERQLRGDDPALATLLSDMRLPSPSADPTISSLRRHPRG